MQPAISVSAPSVRRSMWLSLGGLAVGSVQPGARHLDLDLA
jgi:hypothetical protein